MIRPSIAWAISSSRSTGIVTLTSAIQNTGRTSRYDRTSAWRTVSRSMLMRGPTMHQTVFTMIPGTMNASERNAVTSVVTNSATMRRR